MAVYTKLNQKKIEEILSNYSLGKLDSFKGIEEGIENTNYFLSVNKKKFILTIYEKRVKSTDLPFFSDLMSSLNKASFKCPAPISNNNNETIIKQYIDYDKQYPIESFNNFELFFRFSMNRFA